MRASGDHFSLPPDRCDVARVSKFKTWAGLSVTISLLVGGFILATFLADKNG